ncbi:MAG: hypothetical protein ACOX78_06675 [Lachnospiraceae bacterium]|jgi:hypothetical protein
MLRKKLKSNDGASLMLAILFLLVCAVAGSVILASATASSGRAASLQDTGLQQEEYAVDSAAALLQSELEKDAAYVKVTVSSKENPASGQKDAPDDTATSTISVCDASGAEKTKLTGFFERFIGNRLIGTASLNYDSTNFLTASAGQQEPALEITMEGDSDFPAVKATPSLAGDTFAVVLEEKNPQDASDPYTSTIAGKLKTEVVSESVRAVSPDKGAEAETPNTIEKTKIVKYSLTGLTIEDWGRSHE